MNEDENQDWRNERYNPDEATPYPGSPPFFIRMWQGLVIYGFSARSTIPEDHRVEDEAWTNRKSFLSICFSPAEPEGEMGFTPANEVIEIDRETFMEAKRADWPQTGLVFRFDQT